MCSSLAPASPGTLLNRRKWSPFIPALTVKSNILPVVGSLRDMIREARRPINIKGLPDGYRTVRVQRALDDLHDQLSELIRLAKPVEQDVPPPLQAPQVSVQSVAPNIISTYNAPSNSVTLTIIGTCFRPGAASELVGSKSGKILKIPAKNLNFLSGNLLVASVNMTSLAVDSYTISVNRRLG